ncbi:MAG: Secretion system C-terminal sorting domain [Bacteroidota bacterium]|jgi:hypothetical protein
MAVSALCAQAQAPYLGGEGGGYQSASVKFRVDGEPGATPEVSIFPSPVQRGQDIRVVAQNLQNKLDVLTLNLHGVQVGRLTRWGQSGEAVLDIPTGNLAPGLYMVEVRRDGQSETRKIVVQSP